MSSTSSSQASNETGTKRLSGTGKTYFAMKHYCAKDVFRDVSCHGSESAPNFLAKIILQNSILQNNLTSFADTYPTYTEIETEFVKLKTWVSNMKSSKYKAELTDTLLPIFCHLYLKIATEVYPSSTEKLAKFFSDHHLFFSSCNSYEHIVKHLDSVHSAEEMEKCSSLKSFRNQKYTLRVSYTAQMLLLDFIENYCKKPTVILEVISKFINFQDVPECEITDIHESPFCNLPAEFHSVPEPHEEIQTEVQDEKMAVTDAAIRINGLRILRTDGKSSETINELSAKTGRQIRRLFHNPDNSEDVFDSIDFSNLALDIPSISTLKFCNFKSITCAAFSTPLQLVSIGTMKSEVKLFYYSRQCNRWASYKNPNKASPSTSGQRETIVPCTSLSKCYFPTRSKEILVNAAVQLIFATPSSDSTSSNTQLTSKEDKKYEEQLWGEFHDKSAIKPPRHAEKMPTIKLENDQTDSLLLESVTLRGHEGPVSCVSIVEDHYILLSGSVDRTMRMWDLKTLKCREVYECHTGPILCLDVSPLNLYIATGSRDRTAKLWSFERTYCLRIFAGHVGPVTSIKFHPNGLYLATGSDDCTIRMYDVTSGSAVRVFVDNKFSVFSLVFSTDGQYLAAAGRGNKLIIWNIANNEIHVSVDLERDDVKTLSWSKIPDMLAVTFTKDFIQFYRLVNEPTKAPVLEKCAHFEQPEARFVHSKFSDKNLFGTVMCINT